ncbi:hypothetical protein Q4488_06405 [Amphritea sp. 1_MG-2023]|uniref:DUF4870 family protein n=1 Tax=Amphritea sp. 1_MG-2023 TaxID=3062670 RepID=UPI0026E1CA73|nr:hypothetical protein [Amphritea sp. 1_MG-2023]MDO6563014.1 hypothetical protein [Amphritea sp. 1_MG-2023]
MNDVTQASSDKGSNAKIIYILYLASLIFGITGLVGLIMAYVNKADAPEWLKSHYQWQIRTFWMALLYTVIGIITASFLIGFLILLLNVVWFIIRCIKGLSALDKQQPLPQPTSWLF